MAADPTGPPRGADSNDGDLASAASVEGSTGTDRGVSEAVTVLRASRNGCRPCRTLSDLRDAVAYVGDTEGAERPRPIDVRSERSRTTRGCLAGGEGSSGTDGVSTALDVAATRTSTSLERAGTSIRFSSADRPSSTSTDTAIMQTTTT